MAMNVREILYYTGNVKRVLEMHQDGMGPYEISGVFQDNDIALSPDMVKGIIASEAPLKSKPLPKRVAKAAIKQSKRLAGDAAAF